MAHELVYLRTALRPEGGFLPLSEARLSPRDRGFMFADGVYEVIRAYSGRLFHAAEHLARLQQSLDVLRIPFSAALLKPVARELLRLNAPGEDATVYIQVTRGECVRRLSPPPEPLIPTVYVETNPIFPDAAGPLARPDGNSSGVSCILVPDIRWQRCDIKWLGLLPNVLARRQADEASVSEALFVRGRFVTEGTHTSVFAVRDGTVLTHPCSGRILAGITRQVVIELCRRDGIPISEEPIPAASMATLDEVFLTCTTGEVIPVVEVDRQPVAQGVPGPVTRRLQQAFRRHVAEHVAGSESTR